MPDLNHDGSVNQADADYLIRVILNTEYGDTNLDGFVDAADLAETRKHVGQVFSGPSWAEADFNGDGRSDAADLAIVRRYTGFASAPAASPASVMPISPPAPNPPVVAQPVVALAKDPNRASAAATLLARIVQEPKQRGDVQPALSLIVAELDELTELIAKATAGRRHKILT